MATGTEDRRRQTLLGGRLSHRRVPHRPARPVEPRDRRQTQDHSPERDAADDGVERHRVAASRADREPDGSYRVIASKAAPGRPVGRIAFHGTRSDDPNDIVPHEHRRELRGYFAFAAWLNHVDAKGINSLSSLVTEARPHVHSALPAGLWLGAGQRRHGPREGWEGYEPLVENKGDIGKRIVALGFNIPEWRTAGFLRIAEHRPAAEGPLRTGTRPSGRRTSPTPPSGTRGPTIPSGPRIN